MDKKIIEGNKLIARFDTDEPEVLERDLLKAGTIEAMQYHNSWDWLMPVVEKIEMSTVYSLIVDYDKREEFKGWLAHWFTLNVNDEILGYIEDKRFDSKREGAWFAVVEFIKWHNKNK